MSQEFLLGTLILVQNDSLSSPLPLEHTAVSGDIIGGVTTVRVVQRFANPFPHPIEVHYLFPLPHKAAISDYAITVGERTIKAEVQERDAAKRAFEQAQAEGKRTSLLEQERPNLFTIRVANIQPGEKIQCELQYDDALDYKDGAYEFVFPMGITPRYHTPSLPTDTSVEAPLALPDDKIAPVELTLTLRGAVTDPVSKSHPINITRGENITVTLAGEQIPNKDFVLRFDTAADTVRPSAWATRDDGDSEIALLSLLPPRYTGEVPTGKREFVFVIDRSGSMNGDPIVQARNALKTCLRMLDEEDTFWILLFDDRLEWFAQVPMTVTQTSVDAADRWIDAVGARGGTEILGAIKSALDLPSDVERKRYVVFLTDGAVSAEDAAIREIIAKRRSAKIFTFGLGPSVNRYVISKMAEMGRGWAEFLSLNDDIEKAITRFQDRVSYPAVEDLQLEWRGATAWDSYPESLPDLYIGQPLDIVTRFARQGDGTVSLIVRGQRGGAAVEFSADVPTGDHPLLRRVWARARIESLMGQARQNSADETRQQIISLALKHRLASAYTSFVAVDSEITTGGKAQLVRVAVPLPEGLRYEGFVGGGASALPPSAVSRFAMLSASPPAASVMPHASAPDTPSFLRKSMRPRLLNSPDERARGITLSDSASRQSAEDEVSDTLDIPDSLKEITDLTHTIEENSAQPDVLVKLLARRQKINGSWADDVKLTSQALITFVKAGHTTLMGDYRVQVRKAALWLAKTIKAGGGSDDAVKALTALESATGEAFI